MSKQLALGYVLACTILDVATGISMKAFQWNRTPNNTFSKDEMVSAHSLRECGLQCARRGHCTRFCRRASAGDCYIMNMTSPLTETGDEFQCYELRWIKTDACSAIKGYTEIGGRCLKLNTTRSNYSTAKSVCAADGAHLFHYKSLDPDEKLVQSIFNATLQPLWVGADDLALKGNFVWSDGTALPQDSEVWSLSAPNVFFSDNCVILTKQITNYRLNNCNCELLYDFMCEITISSPFTSNTSSSSPSPLSSSPTSTCFGNLCSTSGGFWFWFKRR